MSTRCLMVAFGSTMLSEDGYSVRVAMATRAVVAVQEESCPPPVLLSFEAIRSLRRRPERKAAAARIRSMGAIPLFVPVLPIRMPFSYRLNGWWTALVVWVVCRVFSIGIVHAQSHAAAFASARALLWDRGRRMVFDVHGVDVEERQIYGELDQYSSEYRLRRRYERESFRRADVIITVSHDLQRYVTAILVGGGPPFPQPHTEIIPCVLSFSASPQDVEEARVKARKRLGLRGRPCVIYLGGTSGWQLPAEKVAAFAALRRMMPSAFLLILTGDTKTFTELCLEAGLAADDFAITSCPHREVAEVACAGDAALLLRADNIVNRVASPTKFAEYLSMGLPVVITDVLADFAGIVRDRDVGAVVPASNEPELVATALQNLVLSSEDQRSQRRERCITACREVLSFESILAAYRRIYRPDLGDPAPPTGSTSEASLCTTAKGS